MTASRRAALSSALRGRRRAIAAARELRRARLLRGREHALEEERALLGALLLDPTMIRSAARERPPTWFVGEGNLSVMRALYCVAAYSPTSVDADRVIEALEAHGELELAGGPENVRALVLRRPALEAAQNWLQELRRRLVAIEDEPVLRAAHALLGGEPAEV